MSGAAFITLICLAMLVLLLWRAIATIRAEKDDTARGAAPGTGHHTIHAEYSSGFSGHSTSYKIPRDPQEYARRFIPQNSKD